ncbi:hypothetical protein SUDANB108_07111 [Streptomyces sp. enrichment culture]|uniref:hypothetical protein n=1 Tax=Streptomyces sp. enrichment culture TaxID=1795815 RepID=UPI003F551AF8
MTLPIHARSGPPWSAAANGPSHGLPTRSPSPRQNSPSMGSARIGPRNPDTVIAQLAELTERHWKGTLYEGGFHMYDGKLPIVVTGMKQLKEHGPAGAVFRRFGRPHNQTLSEAIGNLRREAHDTRKQAEYEARQREYKEELRRIAAQHMAEREARRPVCAGCGTRFTDERWKAIEPAGWGVPRETHPHLCDDCKQRAITAERQAEHRQPEHQEHDQAVPEQKAGGTCSEPAVVCVRRGTRARRRRRRGRG